MKIKKIIALCKQLHVITTLLTESEKLMWIGDGCGIYPAYGVPIMDGVDLLRMNDIGEDKIDEFKVIEGYVNFHADTKLREHDKELIPLAAQITVGRYRLQPFIVSGDTNGRLYYIDTVYTAPYSDNKDEKTYILKHDSHGTPMVMVFAGLTPLATIAVVRPEYDQISRVCGAMFRDAELQVYHTPKIEPEQVTFEEGIK